MDQLPRDLIRLHPAGKQLLLLVLAIKYPELVQEEFENVERFAASGQLTQVLDEFLVVVEAEKIIKDEEA